MNQEIWLFISCAVVVVVPTIGSYIEDWVRKKSKNKRSLAPRK
jgi:hypothetical protein